MLQKKELPYLNKLRIIKHFELDLNAFLKLIMGRTYPKFEKAHDLQHPKSYGAVKGKCAHEALTSVQLLAMEQSRLSNSPMIIALKDATGCFDLIRPELIQLIQNSKGVPPETTAAKTTIQQNMKKFVQTGNGRSAHPVQRTLENNLGGIGQGSGEGPQACNDQMGLLKSIHQKHSPGYTSTHPDGVQSITVHSPGFIDNQLDLISLPTNVLALHLIHTTSILQSWQDLLNTTGIDLSQDKCSF